MTKKILNLLTVIFIVSIAIPSTVFATKDASPSAPVSFTILHTNDFHGQLEQPAASSTPGFARTVSVIKQAQLTQEGLSTPF